MADTSNTGLPIDEWWRTRNFKTSARLHLQHGLFQGTIGPFIHPRIEESWDVSKHGPKSIKVADLGCGNARWLCELSRQPVDEASMQLHGFDTNPLLFPTAAHLPNNVKLEKLDVLSEELPDELVATFDIVHIRAFTSCIHHNNTGSILRNATRMLKPGGWLQWEETPPDKLTAQAPSETASKATCDMMIQILREGAKTQKLHSEWLHKLDTHLEQWGLQYVEMSRLDLRPEDFKAWTEDYLLVWEEIEHLLPSKDAAPSAPINKEVWRNLFLKAVGETEQGVIIHQGQVITAVGQKPE